MTYLTWINVNGNRKNFISVLFTQRYAWKEREIVTSAMPFPTAVNMYHHFCDFLNLYASQHLNTTHHSAFSMDNKVRDTPALTPHSSPTLHPGLSLSPFSQALMLSLLCSIPDLLCLP